MQNKDREMDLKQYVRTVRAHWLIFVVSVLVCTGAAAAYAWTQPAVYQANAQLFVATTGGSTDPSQAYQGGLFAQQRVLSYADLVSSPPIAQAVISQLGLRESQQQLQSQITATVPQGTVLIDLTATNRSPQLAKAIVDAVGAQFTRLVNTLETANAAPHATHSPVAVSVTSPAKVPTSPASPHKALYLALGILLGLGLGLAAAILRETRDRRIRSEDDAVAIAEAPILGRIAKDPGAAKRPLIVASDRGSAGADAYRQLRTNLRALSIDLGLRTFVVSSAAAAEGKTLIVANLGYAFAQAGHTVVLVDADLRRPRLADVLGLTATVGLSEVLADGLPFETALHRQSTVPLEVLASGTPPPNPSELLGSKQCVELFEALARRADVIIVDAPAILPVSDTAILARIASAVILVARVPQTRARQFRGAVESLRSVDKHPLGIVVNGLRAPERSPYHSARPSAGGSSPAVEPAVGDEAAGWVKSV
jgi:polysaccharide biosynthesis transport protein